MVRVIPSESDEQAAVIEWAALMTHRFPCLALLYAIPNGARVSWKQAKKLKREGMQAGVPDLCLPVARNGYHGLYVEMKRQKRARSNMSQARWQGMLQAEGYAAEVCKGAHDAIGTIFSYVTGEKSHDAA